MPSFKGSAQCRARTQVSYLSPALAGVFFSTNATWEAIIEQMSWGRRWSQTILSHHVFLEVTILNIHHDHYQLSSVPFFFLSFHSNPSLQLFLLFCYLTVIFLCVGYPLDNELSEKKNPFIFFISSMHTNTYKRSMNVSGINGWKKMVTLQVSLWQWLEPVWWQWC